MSMTLPHPVPPVASPRDPFVDVLRVLGMVLVVVQHWTMPVLIDRGGDLVTGNALASVPLVTWISQVMPLVFFAGGAANYLSWVSKPQSAEKWIGKRVVRLGWPVLPLIAVWLPLPYLLGALGIPAQPLDVASRLVGQLLWFLAVYLLAVVTTPLLARLDARVLLPLLAAGAFAVDWVRFSGFEAAGYLNVAFVWLAVHQIGFLYAQGRLGALTGRRALTLAAAGFGLTAAMVIAGPYPASMIGMPGSPSNMAPPSAVMLAVFAGQLGLALWARERLNRALPAPVLRWLAPRMMTFYLWHMTALITVGGVAFLGFGAQTPEPWSATWWMLLPIWLGWLALVLTVLTALFGRFEAAPPTSSTPLRTVTAVGLSAAGLLTLTVTGFTPGTFVPAAGSAALALGMALLLRRRAAAPLPR
ncbi:acyltransferase family protein [Herbidospora mongoliensis]|uniref:acyltransferase family protein n=1 Tax=Herbidospora mongoliensis TaxID=688067 RepID=UPI0008321287|nr:acyltransferase [Herbidospora mongoliensis]